MGTGGLSDVLRDMAAGEDARPKPAKPSTPSRPATSRAAAGAGDAGESGRAEPPVAEEAIEEELTPAASQLDETDQFDAVDGAEDARPAQKPAATQPRREASRRPAAGASSRGTATSSSRAAGTRRATRSGSRRGEPDGLKAAGVPVCITVGCLLLVPGLWALAVLTGMNVWRSDWPSATTMAVAMLACLPLAVCLFAGAWWLRYDMQQQAKSRAANARRRR
jgi:hypothetical protein